jgi:hypothetical protein
MTPSADPSLQISSRGNGRRTQRRAVASRVLAAIVVGYLLSSLATALLAHLLPGTPADAVLMATMLSFTLYVVIILWVFAARSTARVWRWLGIAIGVSGAVLLLVQRGG